MDKLMFYLNFFQELSRKWISSSETVSKKAEANPESNLTEVMSKVKKSESNDSLRTVRSEEFFG